MNVSPKEVWQETVPTKWQEILRLIGPGLVWATAAIGSGELIISAKVGAEFGYAFIWALWIGIWFKYWIQKGILDLTILTGEPVTDLWNKLKGGKIYSIYWLLFFVLTMIGISGLLGLTASVFNVLFPILSVNIWATIVIIAVILITYFQNYSGFEKFMLSICFFLAIGAIGAAVLAQPSVSDLAAWDIPRSFPATLIFLSLLGWGAGSGPDLMIPYSWWSAEKGYHHLKVGSGQRALMNETLEDSVKKVKQWLKIARWDTIAGYMVAGIVATAFMIAGAAILKPRGILVEGLDVLKNVSTIFTETYGGWVFWLFMIVAASALFTTMLGVLDGGRITSTHLIRSLIGQEAVRLNKIRSHSWYRATLIAFSLIPLIIFWGVQQPVALVIIASVISAVSMPLLAGLVFWSLLKQIPQVYRPGKFYLINLGIAVIIYLFFMTQSLIELISG